MSGAMPWVLGVLSPTSLLTYFHSSSRPQRSVHDLVQQHCFQMRFLKVFCKRGLGFRCFGSRAPSTKLEER